MEGKRVIISAIIMSIFMAQIRVEAIQACCPTREAHKIFDKCIGGYKGYIRCASVSGCLIIEENNCPPGFTHAILENSGDAVNEYCKMGCVSSVCGAMTTLKNSDESEIMNGAVEKCVKTCSTLYTKGSMAAFQTA
ncbi:hypothetical protein AALP_AA3G076300 [Arabis alpina]|uniref:Acidic protein n=1 Tax=Arabis alpina TaxID=50452 RepID=A0A087H7Q4_ARAAL|nr:hypothetical protein AALP_AA3G076300 [Arabis alpina]